MWRGDGGADTRTAAARPRLAVTTEPDPVIPAVRPVTFLQTKRERAGVDARDERRHEGGENRSGPSARRGQRA